MSSPLRVGMVINAVPGRVSGAAKQALLLSRKLHERGIVLHYLACNMEKGHRSSRIQTRFIDGRPGMEIPVFNRPWSMLYSQWLAREVVKKFAAECDLVHLHEGNRFAIWLSAQCRRKGLKTILKNTRLGQDSADGIRRRFGESAVAEYRANDAIVCMTTAQQARSLEEGIHESRLPLIPNGVDIEQFSPMPRTRDSDRPFRLLSVGYLIQTKAFDQLIRMVSFLRKRGHDVTLCIATNLGIQAPHARKIYEELTCLVDELEIRDSVSFVEGDDVVTRFREADAFVFASREEGFGTVQIEAMASGMPSVVCRLEGVNTDIYRDGIDGFLTPLDDMDAMVERVSSLVEDPELCRQMGEAARQRAVECFSLDAIADRYIALYRDLLTGVTP